MADDETWMLARGQRDPRVWPFDSRDAAELFAAEHDLWDHKAVRVTEPDEDHEPHCARCREPWPCHHVQVDRQAKAIVRASENSCARCGKQVGWMRVRFPGAGEFGEDLTYHGKLGACFNEARRRAERDGCEAAAKDIVRCEAQRAVTREYKALAAQRREEMQRRFGAQSTTPETSP